MTSEIWFLILTDFSFKFSGTYYLFLIPKAPAIQSPVSKNQTRGEFQEHVMQMSRILMVTTYRYRGHRINANTSSIRHVLQVYRICPD